MATQDTTVTIVPYIKVHSGKMQEFKGKWPAEIIRHVIAPGHGDRPYVLDWAEPGKMAGWVAPPDRGINNNPVEYEYVKLQ